MYTVGLDLGGTKIAAALAKHDGEIIQSSEIPTQARRGPNAVIASMVDVIRKLTDGLSSGEILGVGVGCPGPLNSRTGMVLSPPNLPGWDKIPLRTLLTEATGYPVIVENDANVAAVAEHRYGAGRGVDNMVYITVSTGIGGGVIADGRLVQGETGAAAELGHIIIDRHGPMCPCGNRGCLEALASGTAIAKRAHEVFGEQLSAQEVAQRVDAGDEQAKAILNDAVDALGIGVISIINAFDPAVVVIGGGVSQLGDWLFEKVRDAVRNNGFRSGLAIPVLPAMLGRKVGVVGACALPLIQSK